MKTFTILSFLLISIFASAQESDQIKTIFKSGVSSGGYGVISNKLTSIHGSFANMPEIYGGWFINKKFLLGLGGGATTNYIPVELSESANPNLRMSYLYGQAGLVNEIVIASNNVIHPVIHLFNGAGFSLQYERPRWNDFDNETTDDKVYNTQWYFVSEPALQIELNLFKWMRIAPGFSYRFAFDNKTRKLNDDLSGPSVSLAMKFGKF